MILLSSVSYGYKAFPLHDSSNKYGQQAQKRYRQLFSDVIVYNPLH